jgi:serine/threonine protein kinase
MAELEEPRPGQTIGRFVVERSLGRGATSVVVLAHDPKLDREVALKLVRQFEVGGGLEAAKARVERAAASLARAKHPNLVVIHDCGSFGEALYFTMDYIPGRSLQAWLDEQRRPWREIVASFCLVARGLAAAHEQGLIHGALRPTEVLVGEGRVVLGGFGLVPAPDELATLGREDLGLAFFVPSCMAPEQFEAGRLDARSDQFAFCVGLWEALFEQPPFAGNTVAEHARAVLEGELHEPEAPGSVPARLREILRRGLSREPEERWPDMRSLAEALDASLREADAITPSPGGPRWLVPLIIVVAVLIAATVMIWAVVHPFREPVAP